MSQGCGFTTCAIRVTLIRIQVPSGLHSIGYTQLVTVGLAMRRQIFELTHLFRVATKNGASVELVRMLSGDVILVLKALAATH